MDSNHNFELLSGLVSWLKNEGYILLNYIASNNIRDGVFANILTTILAGFFGYLGRNKIRKILFGVDNNYKREYPFTCERIDKIYSFRREINSSLTLNLVSKWEIIVNNPKNEFIFGIDGTGEVNHDDIRDGLTLSRNGEPVDLQGKITITEKNGSQKVSIKLEHLRSLDKLKLESTYSLFNYKLGNPESSNDTSKWTIIHDTKKLSLTVKNITDSNDSHYRYEYGSISVFNGPDDEVYQDKSLPYIRGIDGYKWETKQVEKNDVVCFVLHRKKIN